MTDPERLWPRCADAAIAAMRSGAPPRPDLDALSGLSRAIGLAEAVRDMPDDSRIGAAGEIAEEILGLLEPLRAFLAGATPEEKP